jgi:hypothetical protein
MAHNDREAQARYEQKKVDDRARMNVPEEIFSYFPGVMGPPKVLTDALEHNLKPGWGKWLGERVDDFSWNLGEAQYGLGKAWNDFNSDSPPQPSHQEKLAEGLSPQDQQIMGYHYQSRHGDGMPRTNEDGSMTTVYSSGVSDPITGEIRILPGFDNQTGEFIGEGLDREGQDLAIFRHWFDKFKGDRDAMSRTFRTYPSERNMSSEQRDSQRVQINADARELHKYIENDAMATRDDDPWQQHKAWNTAYTRGRSIQNETPEDHDKNVAGAHDFYSRAFNALPELTPFRRELAKYGSKGLAEAYQFVDAVTDTPSMGLESSYDDWQFDRMGNSQGIDRGYNDLSDRIYSPAEMRQLPVPDPEEYLQPRRIQAVKDERGLAREFLAF